jgi:hypothetical protein
MENVNNTLVSWLKNPNKVKKYWNICSQTLKGIENVLSNIP